MSIPARVIAATPSPAAASLERTRRRLVLVSASGASFMIMLDASIVSVSLPAIASGLHSTFGGAEWVISSYVLAFIAMLMPAGSLSDKFGRKRLLLWGLTIFSLASLLCGVVPSIAWLYVGRAIEGIGAALQLSAALAVIGTEFQGHERTRAFATWGVLMGAGATIGPIAGGLIAAHFGWSWVFFVNVPIGLLLITTARRSVIESKNPDHGTLDVAGSLMLALSLGALAAGMIRGGENGFQDAYTRWLLLLGLAVLALFIVVEKKQQHPMMDLDLFRSGHFVGASIAMLVYAATAYIMGTFLPLYLEAALFPNPASVGVAIIPFSAMLLFGPYAGAFLAHRMAGRSVLALGLLVVSAGNLLIAWCAPLRSYDDLVIGMFVLGTGAGVLNGETVKAALHAVPVNRAGMASGLASMFRFAGVLAGLTGLGTILVAQVQGRLAAASRHLPSIAPMPLHDVAHHVAIGNASGAFASFPDTVKSAWLEAAKSAFASSFSVVMVTASALAAFAAVLVFVLMRPITDRHS